MNELEQRARRLLDEDWLAGDLDAVERRAARLRARRRRGAAALTAAFVVVVVLGATVAARTRTGELHVLSEDQRRLLDCATVLDGSLSAVRVHVAMEPDATDDEVEAVRRAFADRGSTDVEVHSRDGERQRWQDLHPGEPVDVLVGPSVTASPPPASPGEVGLVVGAVRDLAGVRDVQTAGERCRVTDADQRRLLDAFQRSRWQGGVDAIVFIRPPGTAAVDAVAGVVGTVPTVERATFVGHDAAFAEFRCLFADQPELLAGVSPDALPVSFRLDLTDGPAGARTFAERFAGDPGITVVTAPSLDQLLASEGTIDVASYQSLTQAPTSNCVPTGVPVR